MSLYSRINVQFYYTYLINNIKMKKNSSTDNSNVRYQYDVFSFNLYNKRLAKLETTSFYLSCKSMTERCWTAHKILVASTRFISPLPKDHHISLGSGIPHKKVSDEIVRRYRS